METVVNFRDVGGYTAAEGKKVKKRKILRSGELVNISTDAKKVLLEDYELKTIVDLRGRSEISERPDDELTGVNYLNLDIMRSSDENSGSLEDMSASDGTADGKMISLYKNFPTMPSSIEGYTRFVELLLDSDNTALIFHCFAGKDRTGMAAALILSLLGVSKKDIYTDYLLTNTLRKPANDRLLESFRNQGMDEEKLKELEDMLYVKESYLDATYHIVEEKHGDMIGFAKDKLKVTDAGIHHLRSLYTE